MKRSGAANGGLGANTIHRQRGYLCTRSWHAQAERAREQLGRARGARAALFGGDDIVVLLEDGCECLGSWACRALTGACPGMPVKVWQHVFVRSLRDACSAVLLGDPLRWVADGI